MPRLDTRAPRSTRNSDVLTSRHASAPDIVSETESHDEIAERAYELFLARGSKDGHALDDWLEAERMLARRDRARGRPSDFSR